MSSDPDSELYATDNADALALQTALERRLSELEQEKNDLQIMLEMAIEHSDTLLASLRQHNHELAQQLNQVVGPIELDDAYQNSLMDNFQSVVEALPMGLIITHLADGQIVYGNPAVCQLLDISANQLRHQKITDFCDDSSASQQLISVMFAHQKFRGELRWLKPDGSALPIVITLQPCVFRSERSVLAVIQSASLENA